MGDEEEKLVQELRALVISSPGGVPFPQMRRKLLSTSKPLNCLAELAIIFHSKRPLSLNASCILSSTARYNTSCHIFIFAIVFLWHLFCRYF